MTRIQQLTERIKPPGTVMIHLNYATWIVHAMHYFYHSLRECLSLAISVTQQISDKTRIQIQAVKRGGGNRGLDS